MSSFTEQCYRAIRQIPRGNVVTYQQIANYLGNNASRAVGSAMAKNPDAPRTPCHRVVRSDGSVGQYALGQQQKIKILKQEGIEIINGKIDLTKYTFKF